MNIAGIVSGLDLTSNTVGVITAVAAVASAIAASVALGVSLWIASTGRKNTNTWAMYESYNSKAVRLGRKTARDIMKDNSVRFPSQTAYYAYFASDNLPPNYVLPPSMDPTKIQDRAIMQQRREQSMHDLMAFYHQVGLLLEKRELNKDFTLLLLGGGLADRWEVLEGLPPLWAEHGDFPYGGMYVLFTKYLRWKNHRFRGLTRQYKRARVKIATQLEKERKKQAQREAVALPAR